MPARRAAPTASCCSAATARTTCRSRAWPALSISASEDGLSTPEKIDSAAHLLPADTIFVEIEGGNHASFGAYGPQAGDGKATIPDDDIRAQITEALSPFLLGE